VDPQSQYSTVTSLGRGGDRLTDVAARNNPTSATLMLRCGICICFLKRSLSLGASTTRCWLPTSSQIAARPTLMKAPTNQPHRQKIPGLFLVRFICRFSFGTPVVTTSTHHALTLFVARRICVNISCFRRGRVAGSGTKKSSERNPCSRLLWHLLRPYSCSRQHHRARLLRRPGYWQQKARRT
jgi:hypothetical protein